MGNLRDASFSSYLNGAEETFVRKLTVSSGNLGPIVTTEDQKTHVGRTKEDEEEIGVFGAEKYFKGGMDEDTPITTSMSARSKYQYKNDEHVDLDTKKCRVQPGTPSVQSESSWNSQSALLQSGVRNPSRANTNKGRGKKILAGLGCSTCSDKDSVEIKEHVGEIRFNKSATADAVQGKALGKKEPRKTGLDLVEAARAHKSLLDYKVKEDIHCPKLDNLGTGSSRENCFSFPTSNSGARTLPTKLQFPQGEEEKQRKSIDVFGSPVMGKRNKSLRIERRLTMLSWDATPRMEDIELSAQTGGTLYNDTESDASSDLFEIESITGKANPFLARQPSDATSGCVTPTNCYAPSEASIDWSVVTASAADFSAMSDCEELRSTTMKSPRKPISTVPNAKTNANKEIQRRRSGILSGCKSHKAVRVAGDVYRTNHENADHVYPQMSRRSDSFIPVTRFQAESKSNSFNSRSGQPAFAAHSLSRSQSPCAPHPLYIQ
ncbi:protein PHYTOCHROME KINASE SUBSTRATE 1-like [Juglans microcarpa x Juglans regia]|uniref:protein PHYTOCHROME KINASE SUBSTRATE 1-like n=1 Tax=Juglans microcarpa x Juglans regia TaxID=2249226 RepID=UPI001B7DDF14|nr:protein PHYTOCHROME KINASE SUBSTRATE 1-like [Juglans microcarpa x Juglans regia]XP_041014689.1 protein PHYTOCHROME KINASE SUBSTRATE 1-like [Juglans microcarpa x Juglans regia]XP_041014690.1 protein PHYTOCHROME KINASE SUBSTRATE 1-like [Juglans microcarpa x Juglans regia]